MAVPNVERRRISSRKLRAWLRSWHFFPTGETYDDGEWWELPNGARLQVADASCFNDPTEQLDRSGRRIPTYPRSYYNSLVRAALGVHGITLKSVAEEGEPTVVRLERQTRH